MDKHNMVTRTRTEYVVKLTFYDTSTHNRIEEKMTLLLGGADDARKTAWERAPRKEAPFILSDVEIESARKVTFYMTPERFYAQAAKEYEEGKK